MHRRPFIEPRLTFDRPPADSLHHVRCGADSHRVGCGHPLMLQALRSA
jgi:hypothetical protein